MNASRSNGCDSSQQAQIDHEEKRQHVGHDGHRQRQAGTEHMSDREALPGSLPRGGHLAKERGDPSERGECRDESEQEGVLLKEVVSGERGWR